MRAWKQDVVDTLVHGLNLQCKKLRVEKIHGHARFISPNEVSIDGEGAEKVNFQRAIIATGSRSIRLGKIRSRLAARHQLARGAGDRGHHPKTILVIGGGYIGLELGQVYAGLGSRVTVVEMLPALIPGADRDLVRPLQRRLELGLRRDLRRDEGRGDEGSRRWDRGGVRGEEPPGHDDLRQGARLGGANPERTRTRS